ncbi:hypothetical protein [Bradyrhizobium sp.]|uniref:hypothetical protein n=1 Tax=Bradyrhizobium sp. TaxID=376 RepID=UPI00239631C3|nr:hypothetical protein [Bradyrhizobium sp.]MDE1932937.1 hypothetical protein [Bradyrhizobium sp.]
MTKPAIRLSVLAIGAAALLAASSPAQATENSRHLHHHQMKHQRHWRHHGGPARYGYPETPMVGPGSQSGPVCPGIGRSFDCKIWPPPYADDPDRKVFRH